MNLFCIKVQECDATAMIYKFTPTQLTHLHKLKLKLKLLFITFTQTTKSFSNFVLNRLPIMQLNDKTAQLMVYIAYKLKDCDNYGSTHLNKAFCLIDLVSYIKTGKQISDFKYIRQDYGFTPETSKFLHLRSMLEFAERIEKVERFHFGRNQIRYIAKQKPKISSFSKEEISVIDKVLEDIKDKSATELSDYMHTFPAWQIAEDKEVMPMYSLLLTKGEPDLSDYNWALNEIQNFKKNNA